MDIDYYFDNGRGDLTPQLKMSLENCRTFLIITGFVTEPGILGFGDGIQFARKLSLFVFGHCNDKALRAMSALYDRLADLGKKNVIKVHFGYGNYATEADGLKQIYRPMLHSKIFVFTYEDGMLEVYVGSQNVTGYALMGLNSESVVRLRGQVDEDVFRKILLDVRKLELEAKPFRKDLIEIYKDWHYNVVKGLISDDNKERSEYHSILYVWIDRNEKIMPKLKDKLYFQAPLSLSSNLRTIERTADVWIVPYDPSDPLWHPPEREVFFFRATQSGANDPRVQAVEYTNVEWYIPDFTSPVLKRLDGRTSYRNNGIQVFMIFEETFESVYPGRAYGAIGYAVPSRKNRDLKPIFEESEDLVDLEPREKIGKDEELPDSSKWKLITGFREIDYSRSNSTNNYAALPQPMDLLNQRDSMRDGVFYKPRVRVIDSLREP